MKMAQDTFYALEKAIRVILDDPLIVPHALPENNMRNRWDSLWLSKFPVNNLYKKGLNDDHIDTALRKIWERAN